MPRTFKCSPSPCLPTNSPRISLLLQTCHTPRPSNFPWHNHLNNIWWKLCHEVPHYIFFHPPFPSYPSHSNVLLRALISSTFNLYYFLAMRYQVSYPYNTAEKNDFPYVLNYTPYITFLKKCRRSDKHLLRGLGCRGQSFDVMRNKGKGEIIITWGFNIF